mmetsp:Transcript_38646/g.79256  ORF Transcript_38646/g.79256 Transcript_38646/m.79256 type:complete len:81 (-) Transcript_38646:908-1150(-)
MKPMIAPLFETAESSHRVESRDTGEIPQKKWSANPPAQKMAVRNDSWMKENTAEKEFSSMMEKMAILEKDSWMKEKGDVK